jgi:hypothetical protein
LEIGDIQKKETISILESQPANMNISIPLFSIPLLISALLILLGFLVTPISVRMGVVGIGAGSLILGVVAIRDLPMGFDIKTIVLFGITAVVGLWMVSVGLKKQPGN